MDNTKRNLLLTDISGRLKYGLSVVEKETGIEWKIGSWIIGVDEFYAYNPTKTSEDTYLHVDNIMPILRPMDSMTPEESKTLGTKSGYEKYDWLNENGFDYRNLIGAGLAVDIAKAFDDYDDRIVQWYGTKSEVFNLEEWIDIDTMDITEGVMEIYRKSYTVVAWAKGEMDDESLFYDFSNFTVGVESDGGFMSDLKGVSDNWNRTLINRAFIDFCQKSFRHIDYGNMDDWNWDY